MITISVQADVEQARQFLGRFARQVDFAASRALNALAKEVRAGIIEEMKLVFDRPTRFTLAAFMIEPSSARGRTGLTATVRTKDPTGTALSPVHYLVPQAEGGDARGFTSLERLLQARVRATTGAGVRHVAPAPSATLDAWGNWSAGERNKALSSLQAQRDRRQNETAKSKKRKGSMRARFFIPRPDSSLSPGVYRVDGGQERARPRKVLHFLRRDPKYSKLLDVRKVAEEITQQRFAELFDASIAQAIATSREGRRLTGLTTDTAE